jgi:hypothetical protein
MCTSTTRAVSARSLDCCSVDVGAVRPVLCCCTENSYCYAVLSSVVLRVPVLLLYLVQTLTVLCAAVPVIPGWCQRIKSEFKFEYAYLEDELGGIEG